MPRHANYQDSAKFQRHVICRGQLPKLCFAITSPPGQSVTYLNGGRNWVPQEVGTREGTRTRPRIFFGISSSLMIRFFTKSGLSTKWRKDVFQHKDEEKRNWWNSFTDTRDLRGPFLVVITMLPGEIILIWKVIPMRCGGWKWRAVRW